MTHRRIRLWSTVLWILISPVTPARADDPASDYAKIHEGMSKLAPFVGKWNSVAIWNDSDKTENDGTWEVNWALEETYLEFRVTQHRKGNPSHHNGFVLFMTYNPRTQQYDMTYFYTHSAIRVSETGIYDTDTKQFISNARVPLEDGVHDEYVRSITDLHDPNKIVYTHYRRYDNEPAERLQVLFTLTRQR